MHRWSEKLCASGWTEPWKLVKDNSVGTKSLRISIQQLIIDEILNFTWNNHPSVFYCSYTLHTAGCTEAYTSPVDCTICHNLNGGRIIIFLLRTLRLWQVRHVLTTSSHSFLRFQNVFKLYSGLTEFLFFSPFVPCSLCICWATFLTSLPIVMHVNIDHHNTPWLRIKCNLKIKPETTDIWE